MTITIREIQPDDAAEAGRIGFEAFAGIANRHNFPLDFPSVEAGQGFAQMWIAHPQVYGVAAEQDGKFIGSNFLTEFDPIRGVGPITVDTCTQSRGTGRKLMEAVIERGQNAPGIRLLQAAYNTKSMSLYASLGFDIKEPIALMAGKPAGEMTPGVEVRPMTSGDLPACEELCKKVHGFQRTGELSLCLAAFKPFVAVRDGRITAYASTVSMWHLNHGVAETENDMRDLLLGASVQVEDPVSFLLPTRQASFHRWALQSGLRMIQPMSLMAMGEYNEPSGTYFTSVLY
jgi:ribosomal protein S18 acetylase RimI-like enzyme